ncbi:nuclear transport factor 2 family protein [Parasulfitobacter algicola]|uniref:Nuclear transport factor 2 family protein n=1 Tax=Parasulfitobacter algicola TaxID=2614809 RepID=A0ABX2ISK8_9RHOB|nr:nuclear transport factor 2 family protein [Sulfitobacter algicola]NSX53782.1 nuclear transport factor 2 family protein [Sulfitobacter algicola]
MVLRLITILLIVLAAPLSAQNTDEAIHNEIRAMKDRTIAALDARDVDALMNELSDNVYFTAMNNEAVHGKPAAREYYDRMMAGADSVVTDMAVTFDPDVLSALYVDGNSAVSTGFSKASFKMRGGLEFDVPLRWTAALARIDGEWKITGMHFSSDIFNNPISGEIMKYLWLFLTIAAVIGLLIGFLLGRKRRRT